MSAGIAYEQPDSPSGTIAQEKSSFVRKFLVRCSSANDGPITAINAVGVPRVWDSYYATGTGSESNIRARCREVTAQRRGNSLVFEVEARYETPDKKEKEEGYNNPLLELPEIQLANEQVQRIAYKGKTEGGADIPVMTSAGEVLDPPLTYGKSRLILTITKNQDINYPLLETAALFTDTVNSDVFWNSDAGTWLCTGISATRETKQVATTDFEQVYLKVSYQFKFDAEGWDIKILDNGSYYLDDALQEVAFLDTQGHPIHHKLDGFGSPLPDEDDPYFFNVKVYTSLAFSTLGLPNSFSDGY